MEQQIIALAIVAVVLGVVVWKLVQILREKDANDCPFCTGCSTKRPETEETSGGCHCGKDDCGA